MNDIKDWDVKYETKQANGSRTVKATSLKEAMRILGERMPHAIITGGKAK